MERECLLAALDIVEKYAARGHANFRARNSERHPISNGHPTRRQKPGISYGRGLRRCAGQNALE